jgi:nitroreductase
VSEPEVAVADFFEVVGSTRAIRRLKSDPVPMEYVEKVLWAATCAPSGSNRQPWRFLVITDPEKRKRLQEYFVMGWNRYLRETIGKGKPLSERPPEQARSIQAALNAGTYLADHLHEVPVLILACTIGEPGSGGSIYPAIQNLLLAARALGLGTSLTTVLRDNQAGVRGLLEIPDNSSYVALIPMGWPLGKFGMGPRKPLDQVCYLNTWGNSLVAAPTH